MSRTLSFGYNAIAALSEMVVDRLVGVSFADGTIDEIITRKFTLSSASGTMHALISKPEVELGAGAKDRFWLSLGFHAVLEFPAPPNLLNLADGDWIKARVRIYAKLSNSGAKLDPDFSSLSPYDIKVDNLTSNNKTLQSVAPLFLVKELLKALASPSFDKLEVDLSFDPESLASDSMDVASLDGPPPADHDELSLALYDSSSSQQTRGKVGAVKPILSTNQSFAIRISRATFDALIKKELGRQFLQFDLKLGDEKTEKDYRIHWGETSYLMKKFGLALSNDNYDIRLRADTRRANLRKCKVTNLRTGEGGGNFDTTAKGESTRWIILYSEPEPIFMQDLKKGDVLRFHGDHKLEKGAKLYCPSFKLANGYITVSATAVADVACYDDVTAHLKGSVKLAIDPASEEMSATASEPDIDLPWYVDIGLGLLKGVLYAFTGPIASLIISGYEDALTTQIEEQAKKKSGLLLPKVSGKGSLCLFWEGITLKSDGVILHGQIEAGWLHSGGRSLGLRAQLGTIRDVLNI